MKQVLFRTEADFQSAIVDAAKKFGWMAYHTYRSTRCEPGFPDLVLVRSPRLIFAELKTDTGRVTPEQLRWLGLLRQTGAEVYLWRCADWDAALRTLSAVQFEPALIFTEVA